MAIRLIVFLLLVLTSFGSQLQAQFLTGSNRLTNVITSRMLDLGQYDLSLLSRHSYLPVTFFDPKQTSTALYLTQNFVGLDFALNEYASFHTSFNVLQVNNYRDESIIGTGPISISVKIGNATFLDEKLQTGILINGNIALSDDKNVPFYPYYSGALELGLMTYWSYIFDPQFQDQSQSAHFNLMVMNHNENELSISRTQQKYILPNRSVGFKYGLGYLYPYGPWHFSAETWGELFFSEPNDLIYSRESFGYLNFGATYNWDLASVNFSADVLVYGYTETTDYSLGNTYGYNRVITNDVNYSPYFINVGFQSSFSALVNKWLGNEEASYNFNRVPESQYTEEMRQEDIITMLETEYYRTLYECYKAALRYDENIQGTVYFDFTVDEDGNLKDLKIVFSEFDSYYKDQVHLCMLDRMQGWRFPRGRGDIRFEILPLNFQDF